MLVNLCTFNHGNRAGILDQIDFLEELFQRQDCAFGVSDGFEPQALNLVIEHFPTVEQAGTVIKFCRDHQKRVGLIMTEHLDFEAGEVRMNGLPLYGVDDYMLNRCERFSNLLAILPHVAAFFTLGELPQLKGLGSLFPGAQKFALPYSPISVQPSWPDDEPLTDLIFTGWPTAHRRTVLADLEQSYRVGRMIFSPTNEDRENAYRRARVALNIPQSQDWRWVSLMRVLYGLRRGRLTLDWCESRGDTTIEQFTVPPAQLDHALRSYEKMTGEIIDRYNAFAISDRNTAFPSAFFEVWHALEDK